MEPDIYGLAKDLVCDSSSLITGANNVTCNSVACGSQSVQCEHLLPSAFEPGLW
jgi:hypothetical protein